MEKGKEKKSGIPLWIKSLFFVIVPFAIAGLVIFSPARMCASLASFRWELKGAKVISDGNKESLLFHIHSRGRHKQRSYVKLLTVDLARGVQTGEYLTYDWVKPFGLSDKYLWVRQGGIRTKRWVAYSLPELKEAMDLEDLLQEKTQVSGPISKVRLDPDGSEGLVFRAADKRWFLFSPDDGQLTDHAEPTWNPHWNGVLLPATCEYPPKPPRAIDGELLLDGHFVCDNMTKELIDLGHGDRLLAFQDLQKEKGKLLLGRLGGDSKWVWKFHERDRFGAKSKKDNGYRVAFATMLPQSLILLLQQDEAVEDVRLVSLDPENGQQKWALQYD